MSRATKRNVRRGIEIRQKLLRELLTDIRPGKRVPKNIEAAHLLGIHESEAHRHLSRLLQEIGVVVQRIGNNRIVIEAPIPGLLSHILPHVPHYPQATGVATRPTETVNTSGNTAGNHHV